MIALDKVWRFGLAWLATPSAKFFALIRQDGVWDKLVALKRHFE
jgi:hypothetical protein